MEAPFALQQVKRTGARELGLISEGISLHPDTFGRCNVLYQHDNIAADRNGLSSTKSSFDPLPPSHARQAQ